MYPRLLRFTGAVAIVEVGRRAELGAASHDFWTLKTERSCHRRELEPSSEDESRLHSLKFGKPSGSPHLRQGFTLSQA